ncbi:MAG: nickel-responsive transcriptional regulator NikR [Endomicrobium sp.]|jgi:CopG family nickel-responsive transcriptional regulator|nr:nickel-responsive transcriptional regulator NikR [Endomicrobium sp.]
MSKISRFGVSVNKDLLDRFDGLINDQEYPTRSKAIEDLITYYITSNDLAHENAEIIGTINAVLNGQKKDLFNKITDILRDFRKIILSCQRIHLENRDCFEVIIIKCSKKEAEKLFSLLKGTKGINNASLNMFSV